MERPWQHRKNDETFICTSWIKKHRALARDSERCLWRTKRNCGQPQAFRHTGCRGHSLAETADDKYFSLQESNRPENEWLNWFYKARLLTAIARSFSGDSWQDAADAVYELSKSRKDPSPIFALIEAELESWRLSMGDSLLLYPERRTP